MELDQGASSGGAEELALAIGALSEETLENKRVTQEFYNSVVRHILVIFEAAIDKAVEHAKLREALQTQETIAEQQGRAFERMIQDMAAEEFQRNRVPSLLRLVHRWKSELEGHVSELLENIPEG